MSSWIINIACSISTLFDMLQKWVFIISAISLSVIYLQWVHVLTTSLLKLSAEHGREEKEYHFNSDITQLFYE